MSVESDLEILQAYEKYAPGNVTLQRFKRMVKKDPDLLNAGGPFSTFNPKLSELYGEIDNGISPDSFRNKLKKSIGKSVSDKIANKYADIYSEIITSDDSVLQGAWVFNTLNQQERQELAMKIIKGINKHFGIGKDLDVFYITKKKQAPIKDLLIDAFEQFIVTVCNMFANKNRSVIKWSGYYHNHKIVVLNSKDFINFMGTLSHEYGHFIDEKYPDFGMLGAQISWYADEVYSSTKGNDVYRKNPTEYSSYKIQDVVEDRIEKLLIDQAIKKPELYILSLHTLISYTKMKIAAIELKYRKIFKSVESAGQSYQKIKTKKIEQKYPDYENMDILDLYNATDEINQDPDVKKSLKKYDEIKNSLPQEYKSLQADLRNYELLLKTCKSDREEFKKLVSKIR